MIVALAGRRVDAPGTESNRFPLTNVEKVKERLRNFFVLNKPAALVCAGACGADLLALQIAREMKIRCSMVIPFAAEVFKKTSVSDRPGDWDDVFDKIYTELNSQGEVIVLNYAEQDPLAYEKTNIEILNRAKMLLQTLAPGTNNNQLLALIVWNGEARQTSDITAHFMDNAKQQGFSIQEISTL
jgi:hypothetical protein